jgi:hypothetical protein
VEDGKIKKSWRKTFFFLSLLLRPFAREFTHVHTPIDLSLSRSQFFSLIGTATLYFFWDLKQN